jgi:uncharacterized coiled-coil protein SlyX
MSTSTQQLINQIDDKLDQLINITGQQVVLARSIGSELADQNKMIHRLNEHMDTTDNKLNKVIGKLRKLV